MESKTLNFPDAMKLATLLGKYEFNSDISIWIPSLLDNITPEDFLVLLGTFDIDKTSNGNEILQALLMNFSDNKVTSLMGDGLKVYR